MKKIWIYIFLMFFLGISSNVLARQSSTEIQDLKNTCEVSGGSWTQSASGWACCWDDWGCYGCVNGVCKIKCHNERCRKANNLSRVSTGEQRVKGLTPPGMKAPIAPKPKKRTKME